MVTIYVTTQIKNTQMTLVRVTTQYRENYGTPEKPSWKMKGGHEFFFHTNVDNFMYAKESSIQAVKNLIAEKGTEMAKFTYIDHDIIFHDPTELKGFDAEVKKVYAEMEGKS